jgi:flagellar hook assembly protein FlgD
VRDRITLDVVDIAGRKIRTIHDGYLDAGSHQLWWDGRMDNGARVPSGIYWYRARWTGGTETERIVIAR